MAKTLKPTSNAVEILHRRFYEDKPARLKNLEEARANEEIARNIHELRAAAALTQTQLARLIGTTASVICRLEDAHYEGHSLAMLRRIAGVALTGLRPRVQRGAYGLHSEPTVVRPARRAKRRSRRKIWALINASPPAVWRSCGATPNISHSASRENPWALGRFKKAPSSLR